KQHRYATNLPSNSGGGGKNILANNSPAAVGMSIAVDNIHEQQQQLQMQQQHQQQQHQQQNCMLKEMVNDRWRIIERLGSGTFGDVYRAVDIKCETQSVAVKRETHSHGKERTLSREKGYLLKLRSVTGIPAVHFYTKLNTYTLLVMDLLGPDLEELKSYCGGRFCLRTACILGLQMIVRLRALHSQLCLHRDIKPDNFLMGVGKTSNTLYIIDFGLAITYRMPNGQHNPMLKERSLVGTPRYCSLNAHNKAVFGLKYKEMGLSLDEAVQFLDYTLNLRYMDEPDYGHLCRLLGDIMRTNQWSYDMTQLDWYNI
uniref:non-specific serine/threonine protein kinase n=1 Tax=Macrostomum lignano TaxID=282301 RepID=A0A1I8IM59_9PLAT